MCYGIVRNVHSSALGFGWHFICRSDRLCAGPGARSGWGVIYECRQKNQSAVNRWTTLKPRVQGWGHKCNVNCLGRQYKVKNIGAWSWNDWSTLGGGVLYKSLRRKASLCVSASVGAQEGEAHTEVPYRAGFYGDLRKAVTRSGSFSGLISVLPQRRTCVQPPHLYTLPTQSDQHGWTQAANKTRIRRVSTHTGL